MPFNDVGFFAKRRGLGAEGGVSPAPGRELIITPSITNNAETVTWTITSNMTANITVNFEIVGANVETFHEGILSGTIALDQNGSGTVVRNIDPFYEYDSTTPRAVQLQVLSSSNVILGTSSSNVIVNAADAFAATGGNTFTFTGGVDNLQGGYTVHEFTTVGNSNITVTNLGSFPGNANVELLVVGAGGAGDIGFGTNTFVGPSFSTWSRFAGSGGGGGGVIQTQLLANTLALQDYVANVGLGGTATNIIQTSAAKGANSSVFGYVAIGGGGGFSETANSTVKDGGSGAGANTRNLAPGSTTPDPNTGITGPVAVGTPGVGTPGQGSDGGFAVFYATAGSRTSCAGGGGGGSIVGGNAISVNGSFDLRGGSGAQGFVSSITGENVVFGSGGGGGGNQGANGGIGAGNGGAFGVNPVGTNAVSGRGGGGGGAGHDSRTGNNYVLGGSGGSGAVYIRYLSQYRQLILE